MKTLATAVVFATALFSQPVYAALHVYEYSASVSALRPMYDAVPDPAQYEGWDQSQKRIINLGDKIVGRFTFEDSRAPWANAGSTTNFAETSLYLNSFSFSLPDSGLSVTDPKATMIGRRTDDRHDLQMWFNDQDYIVSGNVEIRTAATADQPYAIRFDPAGRNWLVLNWWAGSEKYVLVADMNNFAEVSAVPEPSTYAMLIGGLGLVAGAAWRRRQPKATLAG